MVLGCLILENEDLYVCKSKIVTSRNLTIRKLISLYSLI
jgi:hypothetical protein